MVSNSELVFGLTSADLNAWIDASVEILVQSQMLLNNANVFPVADGDTGTNLLLTVRGAQDEARRADLVSGHPADFLAAVALGALTHARGNSGIILAEYLRGFAQAAELTEAVAPPKQLTFALEQASRRAYSAVGNPVEGTILTAARAASEGASSHIGQTSTPSLQSTLEASVASANEALERSHLDLAVLGRAGVLDAGAYGLVLMLSALSAVVSDVPVSRRLALESGLGGAAAQPSGVRDADGEFEVMCLVAPASGIVIDDDTAEQCTAAFRAALSEVGQSVVVIGGAHGAKNALWSVHVHTDTPDAAIAAVERVAPIAVELSQVVLRNLVHQVFAHTSSRGNIKLVVCTNGPLLAMDLSRAGAIVCVERDVPLNRPDIERALTEVHSTQGEVSAAVIVANSGRLAELLSDTQYASGIVVAADDAQVVAATSAIVAGWEAQPDALYSELAVFGRDCVTGLETRYFATADRSAVEPLVAQVRSYEGSVVVTILTDLHCPSSAVLDLVDGLERANQNVEIIVLASGKLGSGLTVSIEQFNDSEW